MKKINIYLVVACLFISTGITGQVLPPDDKNWHIVFQDTFPGSSVDTSKWLSQWGWNQRHYSEYGYWDSTGYHTGTITNEDYKPYVTRDFSNVSVSGGICKISVKKQNYIGEVWNWPLCESDSCHNNGGHDTTCINPDNYSDTLYCWDVDDMPYKYTSGMLLSKKKFKYGYYEIRMRVRDSSAYKQNLGVGPNFWMYDADSTTAWSEIDVYEMAGEFNGLSNYHTTNVHYKKCNSYDTTCWTGNPSDTLHLNFLYELQSIKFNNNFKRFSVFWQPDSITHYYEGSKFGNWGNNPNNPDPSELIPMPLMTDVAFPTTNFPYHQYQLPDTNYLQLPYDYEIDYIKVWQPNEYCDSVITVSNFNPAMFDYATYKSMTFTGTNTVPNSSNVILRSTDGFTFNGGFTVELGAEFLAEPTPCMNPEIVIPSPSKSGESIPPPESFNYRLIEKNE